MLIREAVTLVQSAKFSKSRKVALLGSFEPLHLKLYLQALLVQRFPEHTPEVVASGYDQLHAGLTATSSSLKTSPTLLCLSWEDIHPALSWRTRGDGRLSESELDTAGRRVTHLLTEWIDARQGAETYVVPPSVEFLPFLDASIPAAMGRTATAVTRTMWDIVDRLSQRGGRVLRVPQAQLNYRDLLLSGHPFSPEDSELIARRFVQAAFRSIPRKKALAVDLDGTLWQGIIGEDGPGGIACRPEGAGYVFHVFQQFLLKLKREGVLLVFCSKNNPGDVLPIFDALAMPLKLADFSTYRCNWEPKSANLQAMAGELNVGCEAFVVVDDDQAELAEIRRSIPETHLFQTPREGREWLTLFAALQDLFATWSVSDEDRIRAESIANNRLRSARPPANDAQKIDRNGLAYLQDLNLEVTIQREAFQDPRSLELINKTNQFNLTGERFAQDEWLALAEAPEAFCWSARLKDRFGDFGTICVVTGQAADGLLQIRQFVLSCRAFGRGIETIMLGELLSHYVHSMAGGAFKSTGKNEPAVKFLAALTGAVVMDGEWRVGRAAVLQAHRDVLDQTKAQTRSAYANTAAKS